MSSIAFKPLNKTQARSNAEEVQESQNNDHLCLLFQQTVPQFGN